MTHQRTQNDTNEENRKTDLKEVPENKKTLVT